MEERRKINRTPYDAQSILVVCETQQKIIVTVNNLSPLGMGIEMPADSPDILGKDIIICTDTIIMYADVTRQVKNEDGTFFAGLSARKFDTDTFMYLFNKIKE